MDRLKTFGIWLIMVIAFWIYANGLIYISLNGEELGLKIYDMTHQEETINDEE